MPVRYDGDTNLRQLLARLKDHGIEVDDSPRRRSEYSYDASNYRVRPVAVAFPKSAQDVQILLRASSTMGIPTTVRGGGTSMAGNAVGDGLVVDLSRGITSIGHLDVVQATVWADAGVVLSDLRAHVEKATAGTLTFAPDPSSLTRATIGGSIGNDACGNHSVAYGRMTHHLQELELVTADGAYLRAGRGFLRAVNQDDAHSVARAEELLMDMNALAAENLASLRTELQTIPRQVSGYHLGHLLPEHGFDVAKALAGSEGTCAVVVRAKVALVPKPRITALLCLGYQDTIESARDVMTILGAKPSAIEGLDVSIVDIMRHRRGAASVESLPEGNAFLMVEFSNETLQQATASCEELVDKLRADGRVVDYSIVTEPRERAQLWRVREDGAGLSSRRIDGVQTWPGWEDSAVAPERLADYLADLLPLVRKHGYTALMYGHFGAGCVHMRLDYDLRSDAGRKVFRDFTYEAARLVVAHGGSLSGEHGDGRARSELLEVMYSQKMVRIFKAFKHLWDPAASLNPGIIVAPKPFSDALALEGVPEPGTSPDELPPAPAGATAPSSGGRELLQVASPFVGNTHACIGVGRCRSTTGGFMCPSYRATKDEKDSTRGRARVLQELTRTQGSSKEGWARPEVREALDLCLSCKACSTDCPTGVDMAEAKSELVDEYYRGRIRPFTHYSIGWLPRWLPLLTRVTHLANPATAFRPFRIVGEWLGISARRRLPAFVANRMIRKRLEEANFTEHADVLLFIDSFTRAFRPEVVPAAARVLSDSGKSVGCTPDACCGLTWISTGQRAGARRRLAQLIRRLDDGTDRDIVVLEPSCAATIRDEGPKLVGGAAAARVAARVRSFSVAVDEAVKRGWKPKALPPQTVVLQTHCHEHAVFGSGAQKRILEAWGVPNVVESSSCCGVAGNFGFESEHFDLSMKVAEHSVVPALAKGGHNALVLTDGFSCAMQVSQIDPGHSSRHLAVALDADNSKGGL